MKWVVNGGHWSFGYAMLVLSEVPGGKESLNVPLWHISMWIKIYGPPI